METNTLVVEDLEIVPNWSGSMTFFTAGAKYEVTVESSATLEIAGVSEAGRRCLLMSRIGCFLGIGTTSTSIDFVWKFLRRRDHAKRFKFWQEILKPTGRRHSRNPLYRTPPLMRFSLLQMINLETATKWFPFAINNVPIMWIASLYSWRWMLDGEAW